MKYYAGYMRKIIGVTCMLVMALVLTFTLMSCGDDDVPPNNNGSESVSLGKITIVLTGINSDLSEFEVKMRNTSTGTLFTEKSDAKGNATFTLSPGIYEASTSMTRSDDAYQYNYNGSIGQITVNKGDNESVPLLLKESKISLQGSVIIKEVYCGGCPKDEGTDFFQFDKCIILYNNSSNSATLNNLCFGFVTPYNSDSSNKNYDDAGRLVYESENFIPAQNGIWYFPSTLFIAPYSQVVVNCQGAINNTPTYSQSVNYANANYYCMYDPESGYLNASYYPVPADVIPTSHYLKAVKYGQGNAWPLSVTSPALFIFQTKGTPPTAYANNPDNLWYSPGVQHTPVYACIKIPNAWIMDGIEVYTTAATDNHKRLTADIDASYVSLTNKLGHTLYRNVNKAATEALPENASKLVYDYTLGVGSSTDPSGIDAEASMKKGAHIIFMDTNNSSDDFHERQRCSLRN